MALHPYSNHYWEIESLRQMHTNNNIINSNKQREENGTLTTSTHHQKTAAYTFGFYDEQYYHHHHLHPHPHQQQQQLQQQYYQRKETTATVSELGPRIAGYLEMNPLFIVRRDDQTAAATGSGEEDAEEAAAAAGTGQITIIPLSPTAETPAPTLLQPPPISSPVPSSTSTSTKFNCCKLRRAVFIIPLFVLANIIVFMVTMYENNCPGEKIPYKQHCIFPGLKRFSFEPLSQNPLLGPSSDTLLAMGALQSEMVTMAGEGWRLITCMWLHAGVFHLLLNMLGLLSLGLQMEQQFGFLKLGFIYLLSGFGGSLLSALFLRLAISVGASAALFGLMGALLSELLINWSQHERNWFMLSQLLILLIINLALGKMPHVDNYAHLGGCISGFLLGFILLQRPQFIWTPLPSPTSLPVTGIPHDMNTPVPGIVATGHPSDFETVQLDHYHHRHYQQQQQQQQQQLSSMRWRTRTCMVSLPRHRLIIWALALNLLVVLYVVALILLFRRVDVRDKCKWCRQIIN